MNTFEIASFRLPIAGGARSALGSPFANRKSEIGNLRAFSLVEVTLALGIVSFALIAVLGLLPVGLKTVKNANEQAGAANVLNAIADGLRRAASTNSVDFSNSFAGQVIQYSIAGGTAPDVKWTDLTLEGLAETEHSPKRLSAVLNITPPGSLAIPGRATVSVAWSAQASPGWDANTQKWTKADGAITSGIQFLPRP
jgi:type II secretory pathway pseudopilin PulG